MSVAYTEDAVRARTKTVTRRLGWRFLKPGDRLTLCRKVMGRKPGEPLERIADVEIVDVRREPLIDMTPDDVDREGVPTEHFGYLVDGRPPAVTWVGWFADTMRISPFDDVTRIEWRYLDDARIPGQGRCSS